MKGPIRKTWLIAAIIPLVTSALLLVETTHHPQKAQAFISCPYCRNTLSGNLAYVPDANSCSDCQGGLYFEYACHACCHPLSGISAGFRAAVPADQCGNTYIWGVNAKGTSLPCKWLCSGYAATQQSCPYDYINSPNCAKDIDNFYGTQVGQRCDPNAIIQCG